MTINSTFYEVMKQSGVHVKIKHSGHTEYLQVYEKEYNEIQTLLYSRGIRCFSQQCFSFWTNQHADFCTDEHSLSEEDAGKEKTLDLLLRDLSLSTLNEKYPSPE